MESVSQAFNFDCMKDKEKERGGLQQSFLTGVIALVFLLVGYAFGILRKVLQFTQMGCGDPIFYLSFFFYILNFIEITIDVMLYFRNCRYDRMAMTS